MARNRLVNGHVVAIFKKNHVYCSLTQCCIQCGQTRVYLEETGWEVVKCPGGPETNLIAVTHLIKMKKLADTFTKHTEDKMLEAADRALEKSIEAAE
jgi:hypothetical protein